MTGPVTPAAPVTPDSAAPGPPPLDRPEVDPAGSAVDPGGFAELAADPAGPATHPADPTDIAGEAPQEHRDSATAVPDPSPASPARVGAVDWLLVAGLCLLTAWTAVMAVFFLPLHIGSVPLPVSVLLPVAVLAWAPRSAYRLTGRLAAAAAVVAAWFAVSVLLVLIRNDLYLRYPVTVIQGQWRVMLLLGLGALTAAATLGLLWGDHLRRTLSARTAAEELRSDPSST